MSTVIIEVYNNPGKHRIKNVVELVKKDLVTAEKELWLVLGVSYNDIRNGVALIPNSSFRCVIGRP